MTGTALYINAHGQRLHQVAIAMATLIAHQKGYKILDGSALADKFYRKGEPDVYFEMTYERTDEHGRKTKGTKRYIVEIETKPTSASKAKKQAQFQATLTNHELIIIDLRNYPFGPDKKVDELWEFIESRLP